MTRLTIERKGDLEAFGAMILWSILPLFIVASDTLISPLFFAGCSIFLAGILCIAFAAVFARHELKFSKKALLPALFGTLLVVVVGFSMLFFAGQHSTPANIAIIAQAEVFFSFLLFGLFGIEKVTPKRVVGSILVFLGVGGILFLDFDPGMIKWNLIILVSTIIYPIGNYFQKVALRHVSPLSLLIFRNMLGGFVIICISFALEDITPVFSNGISALSAIFLTGLLSFGISKWLILSAFRRIGVAKTIAINGTMPAFTVLFDFFLSGSIPSSYDLTGLILVAVGIPLIVLRTYPSFTGFTVAGDQIGRELGFPTINLRTAKNAKPGVYAVTAEWNGQKQHGVMHAGPRPSLGKTEFRTEIHLFDFDEAVPPGTRIEIEQRKKIRDVRKFESRDELKNAIAEDVRRAREIWFQ